MRLPCDTTSATSAPCRGRVSPLSPKIRRGLPAAARSSSLRRIQRAFSCRNPSTSRHGARRGALTARPCSLTLMAMVRRRRRWKRNSTGRPSSSASRTGAASACGGSSNSSAAAVQGLLLRFDPFFRHRVDRLRVAPGALDRRPDPHPHFARILQEGVARPEPARIVRHRHDRRTGVRRQPGAAQAGTCGACPGRRACPRETPPPRIPAAGAPCRGAPSGAAPTARGRDRSGSGSSGRGPSRRTAARAGRA